MIRYDLFRAIDPDDKFPSTPFNVRMNNLSYNLPLPQHVGDALSDLLSPKGPFFRLDGKCNPDGIYILSNRPKAFDQQRTIPSYAEATTRIETNYGGPLMGYVLQQGVASKLTAAEIARFALEGGIEPEATDWIMKNSMFFYHCGGFEFARVSYYFNADEKNVVYTIVDGAVNYPEPKELAEQPGRFAMFREMLENTTIG